MGVNCAVPCCGNKWKKYRPVRFFRLPVQQTEILKQWLVVLNIDLNTPYDKLHSLRVCSDHFSDHDYSKPVKNPSAQMSQCRLLKKTAVPSASSTLRGPGAEILETIGCSSKDEHPADSSYEQMEVILSSDEFVSDFESPEEEEKKKKTKKKKKNSSSDEWEPPAQGTAKQSDSSEMSVEEEEDDESDGSDGSSGSANDGSMSVVFCKECDSEAKLQCSLLKHKKVFACPKCISGDSTNSCSFEKLTIRFDDFKNFQIHSKKEHGVTTKRVLCQECGVFYMKPTVANGKEHVCEYKTKPFVCLNCDKRFRTEKGLRAHSHKLHGSTLHPCKYCLVPFHNRPAKLEHENTHPQVENPYMCPDCPEKFSEILKRNRHLRSHRGPWKHICKTCGKGFPHLDRLERHELIHSGKKPFKCEVCDRSFSQDGHLKSHMRLHTGEKPYKCKFCEKCFNHNVSLKSHVLRYHSSEAPSTEDIVENPVPKTKRKRLHPVRPKGRPKQNLGNKEQENGESRELS